MGGSLAPVQSLEFFTGRYDQLFSDAMSAKGTLEYDDRISDLTSFIPSLLQFAQTYGGDYKSLWDRIMQDLQGFQTSAVIPSYAVGGYHTGGLAMVHGQEIIATGSSSITNKQDTMQMIADAVRSVGGGTPNVYVTVKVGTKEFRDVMVENIHVDRGVQDEIKRVARTVK